MRKIKIADITLRESENMSSFSLSFREKLEIAKLLEKLNVDIIETGYINGAQADSVLVRTIASTIKKSVVSVPLKLNKEAIDKSWEALSPAAQPRLNVVAPTSIVQMEYIYQMKPAAMLAKVAELVAYCASLTADVELTAEDATRSERSFLAQVVEAAISAGAKTVTLCDSAGLLLPEEAAELISWLQQEVPASKDICLSIHCKNSLSLAAASTLAAAAAGVQQVKTTFNGFGDNLSMSQLANALQTRGDTLGLSSQVSTTEMKRVSKQIESLTGSNRSGRSAFGNVVGTAEPEEKLNKEELTAEADMLSVRRRVEALGYDLTNSDLENLYSQFRRIATKKAVDNRDLEAMIAETAHQVAPTYQLVNYVVNSGNSITATACIRLDKGEEALQGVSAGDGPIDAAFLAVEQLIGRHFELDDLQITAVTEGREAMGDALIKILHNGKVYSGRGLSTDIIGASIRAFLNAINKIIYEEKNI